MIPTSCWNWKTDFDSAIYVNMNMGAYGKWKIQLNLINFKLYLYRYHLFKNGKKGPECVF